VRFEHNKMEKLKSIKLPKLGFSLKKMGDFLFQEGPIQSHFINDKDEDFLFFWADVNENGNRWMVVKSNPNLLQQFFTKKINTIALIKQNPDGFVYFIDTDNSGAWINLQLVSNLNIPKNYFPSDDSFYLADHYEDYAQELAAYLAHYFARKEKLYVVNEVVLAVAQEPIIPYKKKD